MTKTKKAKNTAPTEPASTEDTMTTEAGMVVRGGGGIAGVARSTAYTERVGPN